MSATSRVGYLRFSFHGEDGCEGCNVPNVVVQATRSGIEGEVHIDPAKREVYGFNPERQDDVLGPFTASSFKGYFVARFDKDFVSYGIAYGGEKEVGYVDGKGEDLSGFVTFGSDVVNVRVGVSFISYEQARTSIDNEIPDGTFANGLMITNQPNKQTNKHPHIQTLILAAKP